MPNLLKPFDATEMEAQDKKPGWKESSDYVIANEAIGSHIFHVMWTNDEGQILYDQVIRAERGGAVFLPVDRQGRVGLIKQWRPQTLDQDRWQSEYPHFKVEGLGRWSFEAPRGFAEVNEDFSSTAKREAAEETGSMVLSNHYLGATCDNTAFSPHLTKIFWGEVDPSRRSLEKPDPNERIVGKVEFFSRKQLLKMIRRDDLYCAMTLSALAMFWLENPNLEN
jgi:ADP-ribose pyrophosphatase YjhB (NUDIX family)